MSCERYAGTIADVACGGEMTPGLALHLEGCAACAARLDADRRAIASMDAEIQRALDVPVSAAFARGVTARLESASQRGPGWVAWGIVPAAAALLLGLWLRPAPGPGPVHLPAPPVETTARNLVPDTPLVPVPAGLPHPPPNPGTSHVPRRQPLPQPEVIVPPERARAVSQFLLLVGRGTLDASKLAAASDSNPAATDLAVPPLTVAPIVLSEVEFVNAPPSGGLERH